MPAFLLLPIGLRYSAGLITTYPKKILTISQPAKNSPIAKARYATSSKYSRSSFMLTNVAGNTVLKLRLKLASKIANINALLVIDTACVFAALAVMQIDLQQTHKLP